MQWTLQCPELGCESLLGSGWSPVNNFGRGHPSSQDTPEQHRAKSPQRDLVRGQTPRRRRHPSSPARSLRPRPRLVTGDGRHPGDHLGKPHHNGSRLRQAVAHDGGSRRAHPRRRNCNLKLDGFRTRRPDQPCNSQQLRGVTLQPLTGQDRCRRVRAKVATSGLRLRAVARVGPVWAEECCYETAVRAIVHVLNAAAAGARHPARMLRSPKLQP